MLVIANIGQGWQSSGYLRENFCCFSSPSYDMGKNFARPPFIILSFHTSFYGLCCCYNEFLVRFIEGLNKLIFCFSPVYFDCLMCFPFGFFYNPGEIACATRNHRYCNNARLFIWMEMTNGPFNFLIERESCLRSDYPFFGVCHLTFPPVCTRNWSRYLSTRGQSLRNEMLCNLVCVFL